MHEDRWLIELAAGVIIAVLAWSGRVLQERRRTPPHTATVKEGEVERRIQMHDIRSDLTTIMLGIQALLSFREDMKDRLRDILTIVERTKDKVETIEQSIGEAR